MVSVEEAQKQIEQAQLEAQRKQEELEAERKRQASQEYIRKASLAQRRMAAGKLTGAEQEIARYQSEIAAARQQIEPYKKQHEEYQQAVNLYQSQLEDYEIARRWSASGGKTPIRNLPPGARAYAKDMDAANLQMETTKEIIRMGEAGIIPPKDYQKAISDLVKLKQVTIKESNIPAETLPGITEKVTTERLPTYEEYRATLTATEAKTPLWQQKLKDISYEAVGRQTPTEIFRKATGSEREGELTAINVVSDISQAPIRAISGLGQFAGSTAEIGVTKLTGTREFTVPEYNFVPPQKLTIGGEQKFKIPEYRVKYSKLAGQTANIAAQTAGYYLLPTSIVSAGMFAGGTEQALNKELTPEERIWGGVQAGAGVAFAGYGGYKYLTTPITKEIGVTKNILTARDVIKPVNIGGREFEKGRFILVSKTTTPEIIATTRIRDWLGIKPKVTIPPRTMTYVSYTPFDVITREGKVVQPASIITRRIGAKYGTLSTLIGEQKAITPAEFFKLPETQKRIFQKLAEQKAGIPVAMERVPSILGKDLEYSTGSLILKKRYRIEPFIPKKTIQLYHGTGSLSAGKIIEKGLLPPSKTGIYRGISKIPKKVFLTTDIEAAKGYAARASIKGGGKPSILTVNIPEGRLLKVLSRQKVGRLGELSFKEVPARYFKPQPNAAITFRRIPNIAGRTISISEIGTISRELKVPQGRNYQLFLYRTGGKEVTIPFARASGKVPIIKGKSIVLEGTKFDETTGLILKTKVSPKSIETIRKAEVAAAKTIPKPRIPKLETSTISVKVPPVVKLAKKTTFGTTVTISTTQIPAQVIKVEPSQVLISRQESKQIEKQIPKTISKTNLGIAQVSQQIPRQELKERTKQLTVQNLRELLKTESKQILKTRGSLAQRTAPRTIRIPKPKVPPFTFRRSSGSKLRLKKAMSQLKTGFSVLVRRRGRIETIGKGLPLGRALELGVKRTKAGTTQTFAIKPEGYTTMEDVQFKIPANLFGRPKRAKTQITPLTYTELRGKTLTTRAEISALKRSRTGGKLKWF